MFTFKVEHIAFQPVPEERDRARSLLRALGLTDWVTDRMQTKAEDGDVATTHLQFNYQATADRTFPDGTVRPLELEMMAAETGKNWLDGTKESVVSHFGMQVSWVEMALVTLVMDDHPVKIAQESFTQHHKNPHVQDSRRYFKRIYDTRGIIGVDLEFSVQIPLSAVPADGLQIPRDVPLRRA